MKEIEKELQNNPSLLSLFKTAVTCNETQIRAAIEKLRELKEHRKSNTFRLISQNGKTYIELCGKSMGTGVERVAFEHGDDGVSLDLKLNMNDFDFMSDGYFDKAESVLLKKEPSNNDGPK